MPETPPRLSRPALLPALVFALALGSFCWALSVVGFSPQRLLQGLPAMTRVVGQMLPPDTSRAWPMLQRAGDTVLMALAGTGLGIALSLPLAFLAARNLSPHPLLAGAVQGLVAFVRCVPELVWALFFIASVGLGAPAGTLAIALETVGFCGRFFATHLEEVDPGPAEALRCIGAGRIDIFAAATVPAALPALVGTSLFAFEKAVRSAMVLGIVGAGGIGDELMVAMEMWEFPRAATIILIVFAIVWTAELVAGQLRRTFLPG